MSDALAETLMANLIFQKKLLLERAGCVTALNEERFRSMSEDRMGKMAEVVREWDLPPEVIMAAAFAWAKKNKHPDGPMPNLLHSAKYLTNALSYYLQLPYAAIAEKKSRSIFLDRMNYEYQRVKDELLGAGVTDMSTASSYPIECRYVMAINRMDLDGAYYMAPELLDKMAADQRAAMWLRSRGVSYEEVSKMFNKRRNSNQ